jgi:hypothetical protein
MKQIELSDSDSAACDPGKQLALEQLAMHAVRLALARWSGTHVEAELARALPASNRSRWYAQTEGNFTAWLAAGGFAQPEPAVRGAGDTPDALTQAILV